MSDTSALRTRAEQRPLTHTEMCREGCGRFVLGSANSPADVVVCNVYVDARGEVLAAAAEETGRWDRTVVFHPDCYDGRYGPVAVAAEPS